MEPRAITTAKCDFNVCFDQKAIVPFVPLADGGGNRERPFAKNGEIGEAAIRYASVIFSLPRLLCSVTSRYNDVGMRFRGRLLPHLSGIKNFVRAAIPVC
jgi:hypothetical protein